MIRVGFFLFFLGVTATPTAFASIDLKPANERLSSSQKSPNIPMIPAPEAFARASAVLEHFGVPTEPPSQSYFDDLQGILTSSEISRLTPYLDKEGSFARFMNLNQVQNSSRFSVFQDIDSKQTEDFSVTVEGDRVPVEDFQKHLARAAHQTSPSSPLLGLRIAIDPGHMGGLLWDKRTGKMVEDGDGNHLSEGLMALQAALLLKAKFEGQGAQVMITHEKLAPVTDLDYNHFDLQEGAREELRENVLTSWFQALIARHSTGTALYQAFTESHDYREIFGEISRLRYFTLADLEARVQAIDAFQPDITLIIHFDTSDPPGNPTGVNSKHRDGTKVYVPGGLVLSEFSSREDRKFLAEHLLEPQTWDESLKLGRMIVHQIHADMGIPFDQGGGGGDSIEVEPGIFARNLYVQRKLSRSAVSYVECLYYNDPSEFSELLKADRPLTIDGVNHPYSLRLAQVADSLEQAVLAFVRSH